MQSITGANGTMSLYDDRVVIKKGLLSGNTEKTVYLCDILGVQYKHLGMTRAHIEIESAGDKNEKVNIVQQPNVILLKSKQGDEAQAFKCLVEEAALFSKGNKNVSSRSDADEIAKFKRLLDDGTITQSEFDSKKKQLLGI